MSRMRGLARCATAKSRTAIEDEGLLVRSLLLGSRIDLWVLQEPEKSEGDVHTARSSARPPLWVLLKVPGLAWLTLIPAAFLAAETRIVCHMRSQPMLTPEPRT